MSDKDIKKILYDEQLVEAARDGDMSAFGTIVERYWKMAAAFALSKIGDRGDSEDVAQESFIKAYSQLHTLRDTSRFVGWLTKIVTKECINHLRRKVRDRKFVSLDVSQAQGSESVLSANPGLTRQQLWFVRERVSRLPDKLQQAVIMRFVGGFSTPQIAKQLGKREGTVRVRLHRAYKILAKDLESILKEVELL